MKKILFVLIPIFLFTISLDANETTARIKGNINIGGAEVTAVHTPTNISKTTTASESGSFNLNFLPIGGPYKVTVSKAGYVAQVITIPLLTSADPAKVSVSLISSSELEDIEVVASKLTKSDVQSGSVLSRERIDEIPTITRSIQDYVKFDPRVSINGANSRDVEISVMGRNARLNDFTIDGISFNDAFGLNDSGFSTMRNPISIDFVDEIVVDLTPYDVSRGNSVAGTITAVTKTGTNEFSGSVYYTERDEGDIGDLPNGEKYSGFSEEATAITLSGPIIKDKLFFFLGYEESEEVRASLWGTSDSTAPNKWSIDSATMDDIANHMRTVYGYEPGIYNNIAFPTTQEQLIVKLNGIINENHRAELTYQETDDVYVDNYDSASDPQFSNNWYPKPPQTERTTINVYSDWSDRLSTRFRYSDRTFVEDAHSFDGGYGSLFPEFHIFGGYGGDEGAVILGADRYRGHNLIEVDQQLVSFKASYDLLNDHYITFGFEQDESDVYNAFIVRYNGEISFDSLQDFYDGNYSEIYTYRVATDRGGPYSLTLDDPTLPAAVFSVEETAFYIQDEWQVSDVLSIQYGLRYSSFEIPEQADLNASFANKFGFPNNATIDSSTLQPRFSFDMDVSDVWFGDSDKILSANFSGGYGLFTGRLPKVFFSNAFGRSSTTTFFTRGLTDCAGPIPNLTSGAVTGVTDPRFWWARSDASTCSTKESSDAYHGYTHFNDPDFEMPSQYRGNLKMEMLTASGYEIAVEYNYEDVNKDVIFKDADYEEERILADGRPVTDGNQNIYITNSGEGGGYALTTTVGKTLDNGVDIYLGYTKMNVEDVSAMTSAQHDSSYGYQPRGFGEAYPAARSSFMNAHKFVGALTYTTQLIGSNDTKFSLLFTRKSGEPYSVTFDGRSFNGQGRSGYDLAYIPSGVDDPNVVFSSDEVASDVMSYVNSNQCIATHKGSMVPRNSCDGKWSGSLDLRITQDIGIRDGQKIVVYFDVTNIRNLINDEKGWQQEVSYNQSKGIIISGADDQGRYQITGVDPDDGYFFSTSNGQSMWMMNLGVAYKF